MTFLKTANVSYYFSDLGVAQRLAEGGHAPLPMLHHGFKLRVSGFDHRGRIVAQSLQGSACRCIRFSIGTMAHGAVIGVNGFTGILRRRRKGA